MVASECLNKLRDAAQAAGDDAESNDVILDADEEDVITLNVDVIDVDEGFATNGDTEQTNNPDEQSYRYMSSSVIIANQELELPNSHAVISKSYLGRLVESERLSRKLKAKIIKAKQYRSSPLGQRLYTAALIQAPRMSLYAAEQVVPLVVAAFLADARIAVDAAAVAKSCPSAKTLNSFIVDGSIDSILWLEEQFRDADAVLIAVSY